MGKKEKESRESNLSDSCVISCFGVSRGSIITVRSDRICGQKIRKKKINQTLIFHDLSKSERDNDLEKRRAKKKKIILDITNFNKFICALLNALAFIAFQLFLIIIIRAFI